MKGNENMITSLDITSAIAYATDDVISSFDFTKEYDIDELKEITGVEKVITIGDEINVKIKDETIVSKVFSKIKKYDIQKFVVEEASLNEIFIDKVGEIL